MDSKSPEQGPKRSSRRDFLKKAGIAIGLIFTAEAGIGTGIALDRSDIFDNTSKPLERPLRQDLFNTIAKKVEGSRLDRESREQASQIVRDLNKITNISTRFMDRYDSDVDEAGVPRLKSEYIKKFSPYGLADPESMIFFVTNDKLVDSIVIKQLAKISERDLLGDLSKIWNQVQENGLSYYVSVDTKRGGKVTVGLQGELGTEEEKQRFETDKTHVAQIISSLPVVGETKVDAWTLEKRREVDADGKSKFSEKFLGQFTSQINGSKIDIGVNERDSFVLLHEAVHALDESVNRVFLSQYLSPEEIYDLMLAREEALNSSEWGRNYHDPVVMFAGRLASYSRAQRAKLVTDDYPNGIFVTGFYNGEPIVHEKPWIIRESDKSIIDVYTKMFKENYEIRPFLDYYFQNPNNKVLIEAVSKKSPWLAAVFDKVRSLPIGITEWLPEVDFKLPISGNDNFSLFEYIVKVGQRIAFSQMLKDNDAALDLLSNEEQDQFKNNLVASSVLADSELFASMTAYIYGQRGKSLTPNPYLKYLDKMSEALVTRDVSITPRKELVDYINAQTRVAHA